MVVTGRSGVVFAATSDRENVGRPLAVVHFSKYIQTVPDLPEIVRLAR